MLIIIKDERMENEKRVVLCIKPIKTDLLIQNGNTENEPFQMNPYDLKALENLVILKKSDQGDFCLTCVCMGDEKSESVLRRALAMGADEAVLVSDKMFAGSDTVATTYVLQQAINKLDNVQMIVCGVKSIDGETGQVPQGLGERLGVASIVNVNEILKITDTDVIYKSGNCYKMQISQSKLPAIVKFNDFRVDLPITSLFSIKKAKKKEILLLNSTNMEINPERCGLKGSKTKVKEIRNKFIKGEKVKIYGNVHEMAVVLSNLIEHGEPGKGENLGD